MMGHKICFYEEILIIIPKLSLLLLLIWSPVFIQLGKAEVLVRGSKSLIVYNSWIYVENCVSKCSFLLETEQTQSFELAVIQDARQES